MPPRPRDPAERCTAVAMVRMTPVQKDKLDKLGAAHPGGTSALVRTWLDAQPLPGAASSAPAARPPRRPRVAPPTSSITEPAAGAQLPLTPARFVELDP